MKPNVKYLLLIITLWLIPAGSCKKIPQTEPFTSGKGGNTTVSVVPVHHSDYVDTCTLYIKYNTRDAPADGIYDDSVVCVLIDTIPVAVFPGLKKGDYYLFARGYHTLYVPPYVRGGMPYTVKSDDSVKIFLPTYSY